MRTRWMRATFSFRRNHQSITAACANCERTVAAAAPCSPRPLSRSARMKIGERIMLSTAPPPMMAMAFTMTPSPRMTTLELWAKFTNRLPQ